MIRKAFFLSLGIYFSLLSDLSAQLLEGGFGIGVSQYKGDLNPNFNPLVSRPGGHVLFRYNYSQALNLKVQTSFMLLSGNDGLSNNSANRQRNMSFEGRIWDYNVDIEYNFLNFRSLGTFYHSDWTPFLFLGLGNYQVQHFKIDLDGTPLSPLSLDGHHQFINYGVGIKKQLNANWNLNFTISSKYLIKKSSGDKLDNLFYNDPGASFPYNPAIPGILPPNNRQADQYLYSGITLSYVLTGIKCPNPRR